MSKSPEAVSGHPVDQYFNPEYWQNLLERFQVPTFDHMDLIDVEQYLREIPLKEVALAARKDGVALPGGGLPERFNRYLNMLIFLTGGPPGPLGLQFVARPDLERGIVSLDTIDAPAAGETLHPGYKDSLIEDEHEVAPGLIHKYKNRVLMIVTGQCAAFCRYCTRGRLVGIEGAKTLEEIDQGFEYIKSHPEIEEIIFSGGDSFIVPQELFVHMTDKALELEKSGQLISVRFGTRSIIHNPSTLHDFHLEQLSKFFSPNVMLHYNHPYELTAQVVAALDKLYQARARVHSQGVILRGVNDDRQVLINKARKGHKYGVNAYYDFQCDEVEWGKHFAVPLQRVKELVYQVRRETSGLVGRGDVVVDVPGGHGKIRLNEGFWKDEEHFEDFEGQMFKVLAQGIVAPVDSPSPQDM